MNKRLSTRELTASLMGFIWVFLTALIVNIVLLHFNIRFISFNDNLFYGVPLDWIFSQAVILGSLLPLIKLLRINSSIHYILQFSMIILIYYSAGLDIKSLNANLIIPTVFIVCSIPATLLSNWTAFDTHIRTRSLLQSLAWTCLLLWLFPSIVLYLTSDNWNAFLQRDLIITGFYLVPLLLPAYLLVSALYQFATEGGGTAFPYDPPKQLVTGGVYQYISNPMQLGICLMMGWWGFVIQNLWITSSAFLAVILFIVFKDVCNGSCTIGKDSMEWCNYQRAVPKWIPRLKPYSKINTTL